MKTNDPWLQWPALFTGLTLLLGISTTSLTLSWIFVLLWALFLLFEKKWLYLLLLFASLLYGKYHELPPPKQAQPISGLFVASEIKPFSSFFQKGLLYRGSLETHDKKLPVSLLYTKSLSKRPRGNLSYLVQGTITSQEDGTYFCKVTNWQPQKPVFSLAEFRYQKKERLREFLQKHIPHKTSSQFLHALLTGDLDNRLLRYEFGRLGLQHILAISGFHFAILLAFFSHILGYLLSNPYKTGLLFLSITLYFLFVGSSPSLERSWILASLYLLGKWKNLPTSGLNLLGATLAIEVVKNPHILPNLAFQLTFLSTAGILVFAPTIDRFLQRYFPKKTREELQELPLLEKHLYLGTTLLRGSSSVTLSVFFPLFPLLLYHFHQFPFLSLLYNLFLPPLVSLSLFLLLLSLFLYPFLSWIAAPLFSLTNSLTTFLLYLVEEPLLFLEMTLQTPPFSSYYVVLYLSLLFGISLYKSSKNFWSRQNTLEKVQ